MTSVLLIDDDAELTALLAEYLEQEGFEVSVAHDGERALGRIVEARAEIVVLDIMMPKVDGLEVLRRIRNESTIPVLMLTARGDEVDRVSGLDLGADDYLAKPCSPRELSARLRAILRRARGTPSKAGDGVTRGPLRMDGMRRTASWRGQELRLTGIEFNLLEVLAGDQGRPVSRADLSLRGLGRPLARYDRSIDVHISSIRQKLGTFADGRSPIMNVRGIGYLFVEE
ncbi:response regulator [Rhodobacter sp. NSM]|uniref:response regulator n=1 Tax=Rhodobacter sp. NSM TaxID=3457501 RepID=UPI003FD2C5BA